LVREGLLLNKSLVKKILSEYLLKGHHQQ
jgi:hypothetical protein